MRRIGRLGVIPTALAVCVVLSAAARTTADASPSATPPAAGAASAAPAVPITAEAIAAKRAELVDQFTKLSQQQQQTAVALEQLRGAIATLDQLSPPPAPSP